MLLAGEFESSARTAAGETFLAHARDVLRQSADSLKAMAAFKNNSGKAVTIGYISTAIPSFLAEALRTFSERHPKIAVHLRELAPKQQIEALCQGKIDLAFIGDPCPKLKSEFNLRIVKRLPLAIAVPDHHLLALRKEGVAFGVQG